MLITKRAKYLAVQVITSLGLLPSLALASPLSPSHPLLLADTTTGNNDAVMTQDWLLVTPDTKQKPEPVKELVGTSIKLSIESVEPPKNKLSIIRIAVQNNSTHPLVIDGGNSKIVIKTQRYSSASITTVDKSAMGKEPGALETTIVKIIPSAVSVGLTSAMNDFITNKRPVLTRYGADEKRREAEYSRFGKRVVWPHEKTEGLIYFQTNEVSGGQLEVPVSKLYNSTDNAVLESVIPDSKQHN